MSKIWTSAIFVNKNMILVGNMIEIEMGKGKTIYWHLINFEGKYELMSEK